MFVPAPEIFKAYDIRGIVDKTLTAEAVRAIGHALGSEAVARSSRPSPSAATAACPARRWPAPSPTASAPPGST
jgi:hypothetical protein